jgi:methionine biosynthesis protein MetW
MRSDKSDFYNQNFAKEVFAHAQKYQAVLDMFAKKKRIKRFLDIGCGDGEFAQVAKKQLKISSAYGVDIAPEAAVRAQKRGVRAIALDVDAKPLPFKNNFFDAIFCGEVIEHVYSTDQLLSEIRRVLAPGGIAIITTPNLSSWFNRLSVLLGYQPLFSDISLKYSLGHIIPLNTSFGHLRIYTLRGLLALLDAHAFKLVSISGFGINEHVGFGKRFGLLTKLVNFVFSAPQVSSDLCVVVKK